MSFNQSPILQNTSDDDLKHNSLESESLVGYVKELEKGQDLVKFNESLDERFKESFSEILEAKHVQIERLENRLESIIRAQESAVQSTQQKQPGILSLPSTRAKWQENLRNQKASLQRMNDRLDVVRDIKDAVEVIGSKTEELARSKLSHQDPQLVSDWEEMQQARRLHETHLQRMHKEKERRDAGLTNSPKNAARGHRLSHNRQQD